MEASKMLVIILIVAGVVMGFMSSCRAYDFYVGGKDGWVLNPSESLNHWAERNRFRINDTLVFKYNKWEDSVTVVTAEDYDTCNNTNPIAKFGGGDSSFMLDRSGPFFFISGVPGRCEKGQKMVVVVMAARGGNGAPPFPPSFASSPSLGAPPTNSVPAMAPAALPIPSSASAVASSALGVSVGLMALVLGGL